ncbi:hypothetical protein SAMN05192533_13410 [Mesobacillus persicus]|uniref:Uncharacterized protein n=1 Tax=Mesobacillus persicus TaxID=930146 RepID=A0A1H8KX09_9BACI|nr:hypothetical protein [Mesobacillus persicus]SEN97462.1 hypothetical protein SAMN05192533_13410 [Mesobacillus persicus]
MEPNTQMSHKTELTTKKEGSLRNLFYGIGLFIFAGLALTLVTNPIASYKAKEFLLFIVGSAVLYFLLVSVYFIGGLWRKVFYISCLLLFGFSLFMIFYLATHGTAH